MYIFRLTEIIIIVFLTDIFFLTVTLQTRYELRFKIFHAFANFQFARVQLQAASHSLETITRHLPLTKKVSARRTVAGYSYHLIRLDGHACYMYAGTSKYRSAPHKLSKLRV
jgi:hypothetical protein